ncbi:hypothetical protein ACIQI7_27965 [Kitasatospora sp. NPDC092039]|uniref:hypothetical protein n=1 Tax=Kitasatospora sp. NPDC092039 TaxID=3364086 RepID=UPI00380F2DCA
MLLLVLMVPLVLVGAAVGGIYWLRDQVEHPPDNSGRPGSWLTVPSEFVAEFSRVRPPASATEVRWSYLKGLQDDQAFLAFRLPPGEEQAFLAGLGISVKPGTGISLGGWSVTGFQRAGAPDPKAAGPLREGSFLAEPLPGHNKRLAATLRLATEADGGTRVWVEAGDAP